MVVDNEVSTWYNDHAALEDQRLNVAKLEYEVTLCYIREAIQDVQNGNGHTAALKVADIGCGCGAYAIPLAREGHQVSVCDISAAEVDLTIRKAKDAGIKFVESSSFDARDLRQHEDMFKPSYYDIVLLLGPLYHILDKAGRADILLAALEAVKPGGYVLAAFVTRNAHLRDLSSRDPVRTEREWDVYEQYLKDGRYTRGTKAPMHHATLGEIRGLISAMQDAERGRGIESDLVKLVACEGFLGFHHASHLVGLGDEAFAKWLGVVVGSATDEANLGAADHILAVIQRTA